VTLINGASPCNVFWQITSSATLGSGSTFVGTIMALASITMADSVTVNGRALARNGNVTLINDTINNARSCSGVPNAAMSRHESVVPWPLYLAILVVPLLFIVRLVEGHRSRRKT
jgi:hypothetical protein